MSSYWRGRVTWRTEQRLMGVDWRGVKKICGPISKTCQNSCVHSIPSSSTPSVHIFSKTGLTVSKTKSSLLPKVDIATATTGPEHSNVILHHIVAWSHHNGQQHREYDFTSLWIILCPFGHRRSSHVPGLFDYARQHHVTHAFAWQTVPFRSTPLPAVPKPRKCTQHHTEDSH